MTPDWPQNIKFSNFELYSIRPCVIFTIALDRFISLIFVCSKDPVMHYNSYRTLCLSVCPPKIRCLSSYKSLKEKGSKTKLKKFCNQHRKSFLPETNENFFMKWKRNFRWHVKIAPSVSPSVRYKLCLSDSSLTTEANLMKLHRKVKDNEKVRRAYDLGSYAQGQGHNQVRGQNRVSAVTQKLLKQI